MPHYVEAHWNWGASLEVLFSTRCIFVPVNRMEKPISQVKNACAQCEPETSGIASLRNTNEQTGERGNFTDVQIIERGKQRVKVKCLCTHLISHLKFLSKTKSIFYTDELNKICF